MSDKELVEYFEQRRGDVSGWSEKPVEATTRRGSVVFSLRLPARELENLRRQAAEDGTSVSELIRWAVSRCAKRPTQSPSLTLNRTFDGRTLRALANGCTISVEWSTRGTPTNEFLDQAPHNSMLVSQEGAELLERAS
jgi:hypothetical protein